MYRDRLTGPIGAERRGAEGGKSRRKVKGQEVDKGQRSCNAAWWLDDEQVAPLADKS